MIDLRRHSRPIDEFTFQRKDTEHVFVRPPAAHTARRAPTPRFLKQTRDAQLPWDFEIREMRGLNHLFQTCRMHRGSVVVHRASSRARLRREPSRVRCRCPHGPPAGKPPADYCFLLRRRAANPSRPKPRSTREAGSGTAAATAVNSWSGFPARIPAVLAPKA